MVGGATRSIPRKGCSQMMKSIASSRLAEIIVSVGLAKTWPRCAPLLPKASTWHMSQHARQVAIAAARRVNVEKSACTPGPG